MNNTLFLTPLGWLRIVAFLEGLSYLILLLIAMPLKYLANEPIYVKTTGMAHGVLFILYLLLLAVVSIQLKWSLKKVSLAFLASLIPTGTFFADFKLFRA